MEAGKTNPLYYKRLVWLKQKEEPQEVVDLILNLLKENIYYYKGIEVVLRVKEFIDLRCTKTMYEYFEQLRSLDDATRTLCIINYDSPNLVERDVYIARLTRLWTKFSTAYVNYDDVNSIKIKFSKSFNYIINQEKVIDKLSFIVQNGKLPNGNTF